MAFAATRHARPPADGSSNLDSSPRISPLGTIFDQQILPLELRTIRVNPRNPWPKLRVSRHWACLEKVDGGLGGFSDVMRMLFFEGPWDVSQTIAGTYCRQRYTFKVAGSGIDVGFAAADELSDALYATGRALKHTSL